MTILWPKLANFQTISKLAKTLKAFKLAIFQKIFDARKKIRKQCQARKITVLSFETRKKQTRNNFMLAKIQYILENFDQKLIKNKYKREFWISFFFFMKLDTNQTISQSTF